MSELCHFIIFQRTDGHCATWLLRAASLRDACLKFALEQCAGAELLTDGSIATEDGYSGRSLYAHPLACIESEEKIEEGGDSWNGWEIKELHEQHWRAGFTEVFCSEHPGDIENYIELCRPLLRRRYPRSRARAFVWYLQGGPLVTFYRPVKRGRRRPVEILVRYHLFWPHYPQAQEWHGTYDDILEQMDITYPLPSAADLLKLSKRTENNADSY